MTIFEHQQCICQVPLDNVNGDDKDMDDTSVPLHPHSVFPNQIVFHPDDLVH